ncbi:MAG: 2-amino-4-hydroxy-6-hydroxymethyldihydropteridine diphosphokinase [Gemmatimonadetes bacterium]|nr:2-amino-4-hydroxy-6-hydroxymethyldihydropteridine diphosphokinase [Gemmatimonadota bacterium]
MSEVVYLALGSNIGNRVNFLRNGLEALNNLPDFKLTLSSNLYETAPVGEMVQPPFLNAVCQGYWEGSPHELLSKIQGIENHYGRERLIHWGPRTLDIDLLLFGRQIITTEHLTIPHPYITKRDFVLIPLFQIAPTLTHPDTEEPFYTFLDSLTTSTQPTAGPLIGDSLYVKA